MKTLKVLREERNDLIATVKAKRAELEKNEQNPGEAEHNWFAEHEARKADLDKNIDLLERLDGWEVSKPEERAESKPERIPGRNDSTREDREAREEAKDHDPKEDRGLALTGWLLRHAGKEVPQKHLDAAKRCSFQLSNPETEVELIKQNRYIKINDRNREYRAQSNLNLALGGALVPEGFVYNIETALLAYGGMRAASQVMRTDTGNPLPWPTINDTTNKGVLLAQNTQVSTTDLSMAQISFSAYKYSSNQILIPVELLQDSAFNIEQYAGDALGVRLARILNDDYTTGTGAAKPYGIATTATSGRTATSATAISMDDVINLIHSVDPAYRDGSAFMCHDNTKLALRQLKDGFGQYLWQNGDVQSGVPDRLFGYPVVTNQSMDSTIASGKKSLFFGLWSKFVIREVAGIRLVVMRERYADYDQIGMVAFMRADSNLLDAGTHPIKYITH